MWRGIYSYLCKRIAISEFLEAIGLLSRVLSGVLSGVLSRVLSGDERVDERGDAEWGDERGTRKRSWNRPVKAFR
jgi:hypothetical protein